MGETSPEVVKQVEDVMRAKLATVVQNEYTTTGGVKSLAEILNHTDRPTERNVLDSLTETDEELAAEVRRLLFVFEDIVKLDDRSIQLVLREADQKDLALALRGVNDEVKTSCAPEHVRAWRRRCCSRRWSTSRRSASASSKRLRAASSRSCGASRKPAPLCSRATTPT